MNECFIHFDSIIYDYYLSKFMTFLPISLIVLGFSASEWAFILSNYWCFSSSSHEDEEERDSSSVTSSSLPFKWGDCSVNGWFFDSIIFKLGSSWCPSPNNSLINSFYNATSSIPMKHGEFADCYIIFRRD